MSYLADLCGSFFRGDLKQALKCYARTRDYCTTNRHSAEMCLHVIEVIMEGGLPSHLVVASTVTHGAYDIQT